MTYTKQTWPNATMGDSVGARLNYMEEGIYQASLNSGGASVTICTSTTRPATPAAGAIIYETDTTKAYVYASGSWTLIGNGAAPSGAAGGMLSGTYPNPSVASISGIAAGGVLAGTYPNPSFANLGSNVTPMPVGTIIPFAGATAPAGWLFCFGQAVSRTTYSDLYAAITNNGATFPYGAGDGSTTFNLPDLRGRIPAGKDDMGGTAASRLTSGGSGITGTTLGAAGGTETHTLTLAQIASHRHGFTVLGSAGTGNVTPNRSDNPPVQTGYTDYQGGDQPHQNVQPTLVTNYIIKAVADAVTSIAVALSGSAGGVLSGSYPNPSFAPITNTCVTQPVGTINPYAGSSATVPAGWLFCGGQAVSRTTYADLFAVISTTYGAGDGLTTFNVPDLRGRVLAGKDDMGGTAANRLTSGGSGIAGTTLGAAGGAETHTLDTSQMPSHRHTMSGNNPYYTQTGQAGNYPIYIAADRTTQWTVNPTDYAGGGGAHNNAQPTIVTNYIIKALADTTSSIAVAIAGAAGGDLSGSYPNPTVTNISNAPIHNSNTSLSFRIGGTQRMAVDSSGRFFTGNQPAFHVEKNNGNVAAGSVVVWNSVKYNTGSGYNAANGYFTAPVSGTYMISVWGMSLTASDYFRIDFYKNGAVYMQAYNQASPTTTGYHHVSITAPIPMAAGDYLYMIAGGWAMYGTYQYNGFTGYLLG